MIGEIPHSLGSAADIITGDMSGPGKIVSDLYDYLRGKQSPAPPAQTGTVAHAMAPFADPFANAVEAGPNAVASAVAPSNPNPSVPGWVQRLATLGGGIGAQALVGGVAGKMLAPNSGSLLNSALSDVGVGQSAMDAVAAQPQGMLADAAPDLARTVRSISPDARTTIDQALTNRNIAMPAQVNSALEDATGLDRGSISRTPQQMIALRSQAAQASYPGAMENAAPISDPAVLTPLRDNPLLQGPYAKGAKLARAAGIDMPDLSESPTTGIASVASRYGNDPELLKQINALNPGLTPATPPSIPLQGFDYVKQMIDDAIGSAKKAGNKNEAAILTANKSAMLKAIDAGNPEYANARATFAGNSSMMDAYQEALDHFTSTRSAGADEVADALANKTPGEQMMYRRGMLDRLLQNVDDAKGSATGTSNPVSQLFSSNSDRAKIQAAMPDATAFNNFQKTMETLAAQKQNASFIMGGSQTADKALQAAKFSNVLSPKGIIGAIQQPKQTVLGLLGNRMAALKQAQMTRAASGMAPALVAQGADIPAALRAAAAGVPSGAHTAIPVSALRALLIAQHGNQQAP